MDEEIEDEEIEAETWVLASVKVWLTVVTAIAGVVVFIIVSA